MADIINMPNPEPKGGNAGLLVAGFGLLAAGMYFIYKKVTGGNTSVTSGSDGSGGGFNFADLFGSGDDGSGTSGTSGGSSGSSDTGTSGTSGESEDSVPMINGPFEGTKTGTDSSVSQSALVTSTYAGSSYTPVSSAVSTFLTAGRTDEEAAGYQKALSMADELKQDYYVIDSTRNGTPVYNIISGTTGQTSGGGAGISYADAVASGVESRSGLATITVSDTGKVTSISNVKPIISGPVSGTVTGSPTVSSGSVSKSSSSSSGSAVSSFQSSIQNIVSSKSSSGSGSSSSSSSGGSGSTSKSSSGSSSSSGSGVSAFQSSIQNITSSKSSSSSGSTVTPSKKNSAVAAMEKYRRNR